MRTIRKLSVFSTLLALGLLGAAGVGFAQAPAGEEPAAAAPATGPATGEEAAPAGDQKAPLKGKGGFSLDQFEQSVTPFDAKRRQLEAEMHDIRMKKIASLEEIIKSKRPYGNKADVLFRLAEAYFKEAKYQYLLARDEYDKKYTCFEEKRCAEEPVEPVEDYSISLDYYRQVLSQFPNYRRIDEVMYYLGRSAMKAGKSRRDVQLQKEGVKYLNDLVQKFPRSRYIANAHLALGEYYFETDSLFYAKTNYEKIIQNFENSPMYNYALYKLGWVYFNLAEFEQTVSTFKKVVAAIGSENVPGRIEFKDQALNDLVVTWAEMDNGWKDARSYFMDQVGEKDTYVKLDKMAGLLVSKDKDAEAVALYKHLIEHDRVAPKDVEYYDAIMEVRRKIGDMIEIESEINEIVNFFEHEGAWFIANKADQDLAARADDLVSTNLYYLANFYHREAQKLAAKRRPADAQYKKAAQYYSMFLDRFPNHKDSYKINFWYAEILYQELHDYDNAAIQYEAVIDKDKRGEFLEDAALGVIYSVERIMVAKGLREDISGTGIKYTRPEDGRKTDLRAEDLKPLERTDLDPLEARYVKAADTYVRLLSDALKDPAFRKKYPDRGKMIPNIMFIAAQTFYAHGQYRESVDRLMVIFDLYPEHKMANVAVNTIIDAYARLKYWDKIEDWARKLIKARNFTVKKQDELEQIIAIAKTEHARDLTKQRKFDEAIKVQRELVSEFGRKNVKLSATALYNIGVIHESARRFPEAVAAYEEVIKRYPKEEVAVKAQFDIAILYESQTKFAEAAKAFVQMKRFKDKEEAPSAIRSAALIYEALEDYDKAYEAFELYVRLFPKQKDRAMVSFRSAQVVSRKGDPASQLKAAGLYEKVARTFGTDKTVKVRALTAAAVQYKKADKVKYKYKVITILRNALKEWSKLGQQWTAAGKKPEEQPNFSATRRAAAEAALELAEYKYDEYAALKIDALDKWDKFSMRILKKTLVDKAEALSTAEKAFDKVLEFQDAHMAAAAAFREGQLLYEFAENLFNAPVPPELTEEQVDEYRFALEEVAAPIQEKALVAFTSALKQALNKNVYNEWSRLSAEYAAKVNPDEFPIATFNEKPNKTKDTLESTSFIRQIRRGDTVVDFTKKMRKEGAK